MELIRANAAASRTGARKPIDLDHPISWGCSSRGWNCCVNKVIAVQPYDLIRLRHAAGMSSQDLLNQHVVSLQWQRGILGGVLAQRQYERGDVACVFLEEVSTEDVRQIRDQDRARFESLPASVRRAADSDPGRSHRVAGLCGIHSGRPEVCRGFPFQRRPDWESHPGESAAVQMNRCGTCALSESTTPRAVMLDNDLAEFWRADDAWRRVKLYFLSRGLADDSDPAYRALEVAPEVRAELWVSCFVPDALPEVVERFPEQWRRPDDIEGDREIYRLVLTSVLDRADALVEAAGADVEMLGGDEPPEPRPDLGRLLDPARTVLPLLQAA